MTFFPTKDFLATVGDLVAAHRRRRRLVAHPHRGVHCSSSMDPAASGCNHHSDDEQYLGKNALAYLEGGA